jgi:hypothetical protein
MASNSIIQSLIAPQKPKDLYTSLLLKQGLSSEPVGHWTQGAARIAQALLGGLEMRDLDREEKLAKEAPNRVADIYQNSGLMPGQPNPMPAALMGQPPGGQPAQRPLPTPSVAPPPMANQPQMDNMELPQSVIQNANPASFNDRFSAAFPPASAPVKAQGATPSPMPPAPMGPMAQQPQAQIPREIAAMINDRSNPRVQAHGFELLRAWELQRLKDSGEGGSNEELGLNPVWGTGPDGRPMIVQLGKRGSVRQPQMPAGFQPGKPLVKTDTGTSIIFSDPISGQVVKVEPKDVAGAAAQGAIGKDRGEAQAALESMTSKMPGLESVVKELDDLSAKATYTLPGQALDAGRRQLNLPPREAAIARQRYISMVDNQVLPMLRDTFGAAFTVKEGDTLRATLGNPDLSPPEKQAVLKSFIEQKRRDILALQSRGGAMTQPGGRTQPGAANDPLGLR